MSRRACNLDLGDRKEIWRMLDRLTPALRLAFLRWCCRTLVKGPLGVKVLKRSKGTTNESYWDLMLLEVQYKIPLERAVEKLAEVCRKRTAAPLRQA